MPSVLSREERSRTQHTQDTISIVSSTCNLRCRQILQNNRAARKSAEHPTIDQIPILRTGPRSSFGRVYVSVGRRSGGGRAAVSSDIMKFSDPEFRTQHRDKGCRVIQVRLVHLTDAILEARSQLTRGGETVEERTGTSKHERKKPKPRLHRERQSTISMTMPPGIRR